MQQPHSSVHNIHLALSAKATAAAADSKTGLRRCDELWAWAKTIGFVSKYWGHGNNPNPGLHTTVDCKPWPLLSSFFSCGFFSPSIYKFKMCGENWKMFEALVNKTEVLHFFWTNIGAFNFIRSGKYASRSCANMRNDYWKIIFSKFIDTAQQGSNMWVLHLRTYQSW